jgi:hypothetical protein
MKFLPAIIDIKRMEKDGKGLRLCLPVFLLWPFVLIALAVFTPVLILLGVLYPFLSSVRGFFRRLYAGIGVGCALRGLRVEMENETGALHINII